MLKYSLKRGSFMFKYISSKIISKINEYKLKKENNFKMKETIDHVCNIKLDFSESDNKENKDLKECFDFLDMLENNIERMESSRLERILYILNLFMAKYEKSNINKTFEVQKCIFKIRRIKSNIESILYNDTKELKKII